MAWDFKNGVPIYSQIMDNLKIQIASGALPPGSRLPSVRDLAAGAGVNPNTMQRALAQLEAEGLVYTQRTNGRFVTEDTEKMTHLRHALSETYIQEMFESLQALGMDPEEILDTVRRWVSDHRAGSRDREV